MRENDQVTPILSALPLSTLFIERLNVFQYNDSICCALVASPPTAAASMSWSVDQLLSPSKIEPNPGATPTLTTAVHSPTGCTGEQINVSSMPDNNNEIVNLYSPANKLFPGDPAALPHLLVDAGIESIRLYGCIDNEVVWQRSVVATAPLVALNGEIPLPPDAPVFVSGTLHSVVQHHFGRGHFFSTLAVLWSAASECATGSSTAILNLSASGYCVVGVAPGGGLQDDLLVSNPRCGSGSGINLDRVLRKLSLERSQVDTVLSGYLGSDGKKAREAIPLRADRCGVFASSATISDKNQGIPIDFALATTLKSEVIKACSQIKTRFSTVWLTGGVFHWQFARDCAADFFSHLGVQTIRHDTSHHLILRGLQQLSRTTTKENKRPILETRATIPDKITSLPGFAELKRTLSQQHLYHRQPKPEYHYLPDASELSAQPVQIGIDVGSTMAKIVICNADGQVMLYKASYSNAGDTIQTIQAIFRDLRANGVESLTILNIGLTGSARYQIQKALAAVYPQLADRLSVLVENYAHARGSVELARQYLFELKGKGITGLNENFCLLVDIGGEDTKISSIDLNKGDLYDNAMNTKCSAGTGSLLDTLADLFRITDISEASRQAYSAPGAEAINATCAVFLLEHARRMQALGKDQTEILASAVWAIVENMARSLWPQIHLSPNTIVLLHGQTMQSEPLPLAVTQRLQGFLGGPAYCLVPTDPGHRACLGLVKTLAENDIHHAVNVPLDPLVNRQFTRKIMQCHGAACGDRQARCYRSQLSANDACGKPFTLGLGGCTQINELASANRIKQANVPNTCRDIWQHQAERLPVSTAPNRLVIPRSFAVSEWAMFFSALFTKCDIPVHVDVPVEADILRAQPYFRIDSCAPHIGAAGQFLRLAREPHGIILAPQIEFLPATGSSLSRTCTINQGGLAVAQGLAQSVYPGCQIHLFHLDIKTSNFNLLAHKLYNRLLPVYQQYQREMAFESFRVLVHQAMADQQAFRNATADYAAELAGEALSKGQGIALVFGREYVLNPGVYDSHVGRLLRDKGLVGIPSYVLNAQFNPAFGHLYWRNSHLLASIATAVTEKRLHEIIPHPALSRIFKTYEEKNELLPMVQISTFLCGPDSVTNPIVSEIVKNRPYLRIQSDAAIKELAHLENRMNTYVRQLTAAGEQQIHTAYGDSFKVETLDTLVNRKPLDPRTDVICFPTLSDNRGLLAVIRSAGFLCLDNYEEDYSLESRIQLGRGVAGDSVCAPLAAVYGDVLYAINRFQRLRTSSPAYAEKARLLIFNNKGLGPCRQGQYVEVHKLFLQKSIASTSETTELEGQVAKFLVGMENQGFNTGFPRWVFIRGIQATILQGVLHQLLAEGSARYADTTQLQHFLVAYTRLKQELYSHIESRSAPSIRAQQWLQPLRNVPVINSLTEFFACHFHRNYMLRPLRNFRKTWLSGSCSTSAIRIHIDGEAYMRTAQFEDIHAGLLEILGPGRFHLTYTPIWCFLEYKLAGMMMRAKESIYESHSEIRLSRDRTFIHERKVFLHKKRKRLLAVRATHLALRGFLAAPLYQAAGISMPEAVPKVLDEAGKIISTRRPGGELTPYVGEALLKLRKGYDLVLNIAPEGCMVSSMGEVITPAIYKACGDVKGRIFPLFSQQGDIDKEKLTQALLQALGPERMYNR